MVSINTTAIQNTKHNTTNTTTLNDFLKVIFTIIKIKN